MGQGLVVGVTTLWLNGGVLDTCFVPRVEHCRIILWAEQLGAQTESVMHRWGMDLVDRAASA